MNYRDSPINGAESGKNYGWSAVAASCQLLEQLEAIHARHDEVGQNDPEGGSLQLLKRLPAIAGGGNRKSQRCKNFRQIRPLVCFVINNQDSRPHPCTSCSHFYRKSA